MSKKKGQKIVPSFLLFLQRIFDPIGYKYSLERLKAIEYSEDWVEKRDLAYVTNIEDMLEEMAKTSLFKASNINLVDEVDKILNPPKPKSKPVSFNDFANTRINSASVTPLEDISKYYNAVKEKQKTNLFFLPKESRDWLLARPDMIEFLQNHDLLEKEETPISNDPTTPRFYDNA